jgi:hypothetical protein
VLIVDLEQSNDAPELDRLLRSWWAKLWAWLRRESPGEAQAEDNRDEQGRVGSLLL